MSPVIEPPQIFLPLFKPIALLLALLIPGSCAVIALGPGVVEASPIRKRHSFVLGLKEPAYRTKDGVEALRDRLRARLRAAQLLDHTMSIDRELHELSIQVTTTMGHEQVKALLLAQGRLQVVPVTLLANPLVGLEGSLPDAVAWNEEFLAGDRVDGYLHSASQAALSQFVSKLVLAEFYVYVAPTLTSDAVMGFRTCLVEKNAPTLGSAGLAEVTIHPHSYPNYYYVKVYWSDTEAQNDAGKLVGKELGGASGLFTVTSAASGDRVVVLMDGEAVGAVSISDPVDDGRLIIRLPRLDKDSQRDKARQLAGQIASGPHPCEIVVVRAEVVDR